jgi:hypothetical protein
VAIGPDAPFDEKRESRFDFDAEVKALPMRLLCKATLVNRAQMLGLQLSPPEIRRGPLIRVHREIKVILITKDFSARRSGDHRGGQCRDRGLSASRHELLQYLGDVWIGLWFEWHFMDGRGDYPNC